MRELIEQTHKTLDAVEKQPLLNIGKAVAVARSTLALVTDLNNRLEVLEGKRHG